MPNFSFWKIALLVLKVDFSISIKSYGLGKKFLIDGFKNELISSFLICLIDSSFDVISSNEKLSLKKFEFSSLYFLSTQFFPHTEIKSFSH